MSDDRIRADLEEAARPPKSSALWGHHPPCGSTWKVIEYPGTFIDLNELVQAMQRARCPRCGVGPKGILQATKEQVEAAEAGHASIH